MILRRLAAAARCLAVVARDLFAAEGRLFTAERGGAGVEWGGWRGPRCAAGTAGWLLGSPSRKAATSGHSAADVGAASAAYGLRSALRACQASPAQDRFQMTLPRPRRNGLVTRGQRSGSSSCKANVSGSETVCLLWRLLLPGEEGASGCRVNWVTAGMGRKVRFCGLDIGETRRGLGLWKVTGCRPELTFTASGRSGRYEATNCRSAPSQSEGLLFTYRTLVGMLAQNDRDCIVDPTAMAWPKLACPSMHRIPISSLHVMDKRYEGPYRAHSKATSKAHRGPRILFAALASVRTATVS